MIVGMKYLCLIYVSEETLDAMPVSEMQAVNIAHHELNDRLRSSGHFIEADALQPAKQAAWLRIRDGKMSVTDGPYTEAKELVAGFYLIEARDMKEALEIASRLPSAKFGTVEVRPTRQLVTDREADWRG
jgi:hypothetical protein